MANLVSGIILVFFFYGRSLRRTNIRRHIWVMSGVIFSDLVLVALLVCMRDALSKVSPQMHWSLMVHIPIAVSTVLLYFVGVYLGLQLMKGRREFLPAMRRFDRIIVPLRVLTFVTSLMVQFLKS